MPWYGWLLLSAGLFIAFTLVAFRVLRATQRGRRFFALPTRSKLRFGQLLLTDPAVPLYAKAILVVLVGYLALPFDLIPDFIPILGQADDLAVVVLAITLLLVAVPRDRFEAALACAEGEAEERRQQRARVIEGNT